MRDLLASVPGVKPKFILSSLQDTFPTHSFYITAIYNAMSKLRPQELDGRTPVQSMIDLLSEQGDYRFTILNNSNGEMIAFFFTHRESIDRFNRSNNAVVMDSTYRTNRLCMLFLEVVGMNLNNSTFFLCGCFMTGEFSECYKWALGQMRNFCFIDAAMPKVMAADRELSLILAIEETFPGTAHLLCRLHIEKNILAKLAASFGRRVELLRLWTFAVTNSMTEELWIVNFYEFISQPELQVTTVDSESKEVEEVHPFTAYLKDTWERERKKKVFLAVKKKSPILKIVYLRFVSAYTNSIRHLNASNTSRVEGAHAYIKGFIESRNLDIDKVVRRMDTAIGAQLSKLKTEELAGRVRVCPALRIAHDQLQNREEAIVIAEVKEVNLLHNEILWL